MFLYDISGLVVSVEGCSDKALLDAMQPYSISANDPVPDVSVTITKCDEPIPMGEAKCMSISDTEFWSATGDTLSYYLVFPEVEGAAVCAECNVDFSIINIYTYDVKKHLGYDDSSLLLNTMSAIMHYIALMHGRLVFHSSSIAVNGCGIAFSADSGVGKSTHTSLWMQHIEGVEYINDDTPVITCTDGDITICGSPFAGTSGINNDIRVPLKAIVFVTRGDNNRLIQVDTITAFTRIMLQLKKPVTDSMTNRLIDNLNCILKDIPCYLMQCNISSEAPLVAYKTIFNDK